MTRGKKIRWVTAGVVGLIVVGIGAGWLLRASSFSYSYHATQITAHDNTSFISSVNNGDNWFVAGDVGLVVLDGDPLTRRVADALAVRLRKVSGVRSVKVFAKLPVDPDRDFVLGIRTPKVVRTPGRLTRKLEATVILGGGTATLPRTGGYIDGRTPPTSKIDFTVTDEHKSTTKGSESDPFGQAVDKIAKQLDDKLSELFKTYAPNRPAQALPVSFFGQPRGAHPGPQFAFVGRYKAQLIQQRRGLFMRDQRWWRFPTPADPGAMVRQIQKELEADGWHVFVRGMSPGHPPTLDNLHFRATRDDAILILSFARRGSQWGDPEVWDYPAGQPRAVYIRYRDRFGQDEQYAAIDDIIVQPGVPTGVLLRLRSKMNHPQERELLHRLLNEPKKTYAYHKVVAELLHRTKDDDAAREVLGRAADAAVAEGLFGDRVLAVPRLAEQVKDEELARPVTVEQLEAWGMRACPTTPSASGLPATGQPQVAATSSNDSDSAVAMVQGDQPAWFYYARPEAEGTPAMLIRVRVAPNRDGARALHVRTIDADGGGSGSSVSPGSVTHGVWLATCHSGMNSVTPTVVAQSEEDGRYRITVTVEDRKTPKPGVGPGVGEGATQTGDSTHG